MSTLIVAFEDFILSREAALCSPQTLDFYRGMLRPFLAAANGSPPSNRKVRKFLASVAERGVASTTVSSNEAGEQSSPSDSAGEAVFSELIEWMY